MNKKEEIIIQVEKRISSMNCRLINLHKEGKIDDVELMKIQIELTKVMIEYGNMLER